ncbi:hypothetical protein BT96DRAFT_959974 [Gymnopus androsaceus JB14]|uniref:Tc1-like transposase DDE domain-containing protein n=1 Tax=Gymnopus androsaceus JB14 TaxID=1447944 RepID=A0A6A4GX59_9AGAR|nr:hypothetical protein BT96DRAFT_959974 [Gymnopus androsaceus JB14]
MKYTALCMWESGWDLDDICSVLVVSPSSMYCRRAILEEFGDVNQPPSGLHGQPRLIGMLAMQACCEVYARNPENYLDELQWFLAVEHDIAISIPSLQSNLEKAGLTCKLLHKIAIERDYQPMSLKGYIATQVVEGSFDTSEYVSFLLDDVAPQMKPYPDEQSVLVMDNCCIHHSEVLKEALNSKGIHTSKYYDSISPTLFSRLESH